jgi:15-cis-phytoene synthase
MQLTNICREVREDWQLGRLYIPADLLRDVGVGWLCELVGRGHPLPVEARAPLGRALRRLLAEADVFYRSGDTGLSALSFRCELAVRTARLVYAAIGDTIAQSRHNVFAARAVVPAGTKLVLAGVACAGAAASLPMRLDRPFREARLVAPLRFPDDILVFSNEPTDATP